MIFSLIEYFYFGTFFPSTFSTKIIQGKNHFFGDNFRDELLHLKITSGLLYGQRKLTDAISFLLVVITCLVLSFKIFFKRNNDHYEMFYFIVIAFGLLQFISYSILGVQVYIWYKAPIIYSILFMIFALQYLVKKINSIKMQFQSSFTYNNFSNDFSFCINQNVLFSPKLLFFVILIIAIVLLNQNKNHVGKTMPYTGALGESYKKAAQKINNLVKPNDIVLLGECGITGYYLNSNVIDYYGVVTPDVLNNFENQQKSFLKAVNEYKPKVIFTHKGYADSVMDKYRIEEKFPMNYANWEYYILIRKD